MLQLESEPIVPKCWPTPFSRCQLKAVDPCTILRGESTKAFILANSLIILSNVPVYPLQIFNVSRISFGAYQFCTKVGLLDYLLPQKCFVMPKIRQFFFSRGSLPDPAGELTTLPTPVVGCPL